jgi:hypothetical protein
MRAVKRPNATPRTYIALNGMKGMFAAKPQRRVEESAASIAS